MKTILAGLVTAFSFYSALPVPKIAWKRDNMRYVLCFFPLVGVVVGAAVLLWYRLCLHVQVVPGLFAAVATLLPAVLTGGIHIDGLIDTADALGSRASPEKKQEILQDVHTGAFGVLFCAGYLLLCFGLWLQLFARGRLFALALVGYVVSRACNALSIAVFPTARQSGLVFLFADSASRRAAVAVCAAVLVAMLALSLVISPLWGGVAAVCAAGYFLWHRRTCEVEFGGNSGDLAGFLLMNLELLYLAVAVIGGLVG